MEPFQSSRRDVLRIGTALAGLTTLGSLAGCASQQDPDQTPDGSEQLTRVPAAADGTLHADAETVLSDRGTEHVVNAFLHVKAQRSWYSGPESFEGLLSSFTDEIGLDAEGVTSTTPFWAWNTNDTFHLFSQSFYGWLVRANWSKDNLVTAIEQANTDYTEREYTGQPVYEPTRQGTYWMGVVDDGEYVLGSESAVKDAIDVQHDDGDQLSDGLKSAYASTRPGPVRFVGTIPAAQLPDSAGPNDQYDLTILDDIETVTGAIYVNGDNRGIETRFSATDEGTADDAAAMLDGLMTLASDEANADELAAALDEVAVAQDGTNVVVSYEASISDLADLVEASMDSGSSRSQQARQTPMAKFTYEYEETKGNRGTLTITHEGGDTIKQSELYVRGSGFAVVPETDMRASGQWAGSASGTMNQESAVVAGDSVTVGVTSAYEIRVIYESSDGDAAATLAMDTGPDA